MLNVGWVDKHNPCLQDHSPVEKRDNTHFILYMCVSVLPNSSLCLETYLC